jgi:hypothetical protein
MKAKHPNEVEKFEFEKNGKILPTDLKSKVITKEKVQPTKRSPAKLTLKKKATPPVVFIPPKSVQAVHNFSIEYSSSTLSKKDTF